MEIALERSMEISLERSIEIVLEAPCMSCVR
jgi:hypothetical protein